MDSFSLIEWAATAVEEDSELWLQFTYLQV